MDEIRYKAAKYILDNHEKYSVEEVLRALRYLIENGDTEYIEAIILTSPVYRQEIVLEAIKLCNKFKGSNLIKLMNPIFNHPELYGEEEKFDAAYIAIGKNCIELLYKVTSSAEFSEYTRKLVSEYLFEKKKPKREDYEMDRFHAIAQQYFSKKTPEPTKQNVFSNEPGCGDPEVYQALTKLELCLRIFIEEKLSSLSPDWWKQRIPGDVIENAELRKKDNEKPWPWFDSGEYSLIHYVDFNDYEKIIVRKDNWREVFEKSSRINMLFQVN